MSLPIRVELEHDDAALVRIIRTAWSRCAPARSANSTSAPVASVRFSATDTQSSVGLMSGLSTRVTLEAISQWSGEKLLFHAAGLSAPGTGLASVLVASSGTGKTTASQALGQSLEYLSDETVCVDPKDLDITGYPKPLSVIVEPAQPKAQVSPDELGLLPQTRPARMNHLFVLQRDPQGPAGDISDPLPLQDALELLAPNISALPLIPRPLSTLIAIIGRVGGVRAVRYQEIENVREMLATTTATASTPVARQSALTSWLNPTPPTIASDPNQMKAPLPEPGLDADRNGTPGTEPNGVVVYRSVYASPWVEAVENPEAPEQLIILLAEQLVVIAGIAPTVWHECRKHGERTPQQLEVAVVEAFGENPHAKELVNRCVAELVRTGVLQPA